MTDVIKLAVSGAGGGMGGTIWNLANQDERFQVVAVFEKPGHSLIGQKINGLIVTDKLDGLKEADALIEFTAPAATVEHVVPCVLLRKAMIIGTTGLSADDVAVVETGAKDIPILFSPNMSFGANYTLKLAAKMAKDLGLSWDIEGIEFHRKPKSDKPSGTAKKGVQLIKDATGREEIPFHAVRIGAIAGIHQFYFARPGERITLIHEAESRELFARGALDFVPILVAKPAGLYSPDDLL